MKRVKFYFPAVIAFILLFSFDVSANEQKARQFIEDLSSKVLRIVNSNNETGSNKEERLEEIFKQFVNTRWMGRFVLGRYYRQVAPEQKTRYLALYADFLIKSYIPRFRDYAGQKFKILGVIAKGDGQYLVQTELTSNSDESPPVRVDYRLIKSGDDGRFSIIDIVGEGISLITTQRSDFGGLISRKGISYFIDRLQEKVNKFGQNSRKPA